MDILNKSVGDCDWGREIDESSVLRCLPDLEALMLNIGTNFAPEHLEEMFLEPRLGIRRMEMRFKPYVEQASYYQFLKGPTTTLCPSYQADKT